MNRTYLPFRRLLEQRGYTVYFDGKQKTALAICPGRKDLFVDYGDLTAWIDADRINARVRLINKRIYIESAYFSAAGISL